MSSSTWARDLATLMNASAAGLPDVPPSAIASCQRKVKRVHLGVFFDGTGNNRYRDTPRGSDTNVAKLHSLYVKDPGPVEWQESTYIVGVGGIDAEARDRALEKLKAVAVSPDDSLLERTADRVGSTVATTIASWSSAIRETLGGAGGRGGFERLNAAYAFADACCRAVPPDTDVTIDVFGFSRGASLARTFCNLVDQALEPAHPRVKLRFLGIFDTVGSFGLAGDDSEPGQNLHVPDGIQRVVHCCALHEYRDFFPLTSADPPECMVDPRDTWYVGAHSDVGGGYAPGEDGKLNHLALIPLVDVYKAGVREGLRLRDVGPLLGVDVEQLRSKADRFARDFNDAVLAGQLQQVTEFFETYVHVSATGRWSFWSKDRREFSGKRETFTTSPRRLVAPPPDFDWS